MAFNINHIDNMQLDIIKEIANIGAGNAATSLYKMINKPINMNVPKVNIISFQDVEMVIGGAGNLVVGIYLEFHGDINGTIMFILDRNSSENLINLLMGDMVYNKKDCFSELGLSALKEVGNILTGAYLGALSQMTNLVIKHSVPDLAIDMAGAILSVPMIEFGQIGDKALFIETDFIDGLKLIKGHFFLIPRVDSYSVILSALGVV